MYLPHKGLLFAHIPKTAGTSFRLSVERHVKGWKVYSDYGETNATTSRWIRKCYQMDDFSKVNEINEKNTLLAGHFPIRKYLPYYPIDKVITFVRDPVQRVISHYHDLQRRIGYSDSLETYINERKYQNQQSKFFQDIPIEAVGFIGICEFYDESIELIRKIYDIDVPVKKLNANKKKENDFYYVPGDIAEQIKETNDKDCQIYDKTLALFNTRRELVGKSIPYVHGKISRILPDKIEGWATNPFKKESVKLKLNTDDGEVYFGIANEPRDELESINIDADNEIGFTINLDKKILDNSKLVLEVEDTGQLITC